MAKMMPIGEGVESIGANAFDFTQIVPSVNSVTIPKSVTRIGYSAFNASSLTFNGTKVEWNLIIKPSYGRWPSVTCVDGTISSSYTYP